MAQRRDLLMSNLNLGTLVRLLIACVIVGALMAFIGVTPRDIAHSLAGLASQAVRNAAAWAGNFVSYLLLGAVIVIPVWLISLLFRSFRGR
jgi:hypothetical protein